MKFVHLCNKYAVKDVNNFKFDPNRQYTVDIESDEEYDIKKNKEIILRDFKPSGFWVSPVVSDKNSHTFYDFIMSSMKQSYHMKKFYFEINDDIFINWSEEASGTDNSNKILVIKPEDIPKLHRLYKTKNNMTSLNFSWVRKEYGGVMFKPYEYSLRMKYMWYAQVDGESASVWNLNLINQIGNI